MNTTNKVLIGVGIMAAGVGGYFGYRNYLENDIVENYKLALKSDGRDVATDSTAKMNLERMQNAVNQLSFSDLKIYHEAMMYQFQSMQIPKPYAIEEVIPDPNGTKYNQSRMLPTENGKKHEELFNKARTTIVKMSEKGKEILANVE